MIVILSCGHWFTELRPEGAAEPRHGELRACGHPYHYPKQYTATYAVTDHRIGSILESSPHEDPLETIPDPPRPQDRKEDLKTD